MADIAFHAYLPVTFSRQNYSTDLHEILQSDRQDREKRHRLFTGCEKWVKSQGTASENIMV